jgi:hypothetical protein
MKPARLFGLAFLLFMGVSVAGAQSSLRFRFEIYRNGRAVGTPELAVVSGGHGRLAIDGIGEIAFTPAPRDSESVSVAFDIDLGDKHLRPQLTLRANDPGSLSWTSSGEDAFKVTVAWIR